MHGCTEAIDDDIRIQCIVHYDNDLCFVDPDADANFEMEGDDLYEVLPIIPEDVQLPSIANFVEAQKADSLCERLTATVGEPGTQLDTNENGILVRRAAPL